MEEVETIIIGAGLSGVACAARLVAQNRSVLVLEARSRIGGRILCPEHQDFFADLGPSWFWPMVNPEVSALVQDLGVKSYPQFEQGLALFETKDGHVQTVSGCPMEPPAFRLEGGMMALVKGLLARGGENCIRLDHPVCEIRRLDHGCRVSVGHLDQPPRCELTASNVILALPPRLAAGSILFTPDLSYDLSQAMLKASTWMAGHAKFFALYDRASWRRLGLSGQAFSQRGPLGEIHDGSGAGDTPYGLTGFAGIPALRRKDEKTMSRDILAQLAQLFGSGAAQPLALYYQDWATEAFTATEYDKRSCHNHPEFYPPGGRTSIWNNTLHFAGTETAGQFGGYLEGALVSARRAAAAV
ncbi:flavin monoamine oxidase family protein [Desulfobacter vibrioformis]|uniref:flavin monoamine oxidase family protein n=1 Tax=Desulfobacter vibrioformis TaxID=34031 RepID=UPI000550E3FA|nr:FAD-dependent oxidoreductase [Desulfobacter vibrioformis]